MSNQDRCRETRRLLSDGAYLLDVRSPQEFAAGALPNAVNLPVESVLAAQELFQQGQPLVVYCASGRRSAMAKQVLGQLGFDDVHDLGSYANIQLCH
ncbi:MAG: rhodanese-like domain-containing protein [bacterium]